MSTVKKGVRPLKSILKEKEELLDEFGIRVDRSMLEHIESLYPNEVAIENYTRTLIVEWLGRFE